MGQTAEKAKLPILETVSDDREYQPGDKVYLSTRNLRFKGPGRKLAPRYVGPFEVLKKVGAVSYRLRLPVELRIHPVFHASLFKPCDSIDEPPIVLHPDFVPNADPEECEVEAVLDMKVEQEEGRPLRYFLLQWKGYHPSAATWEPESNLRHTRGLIQDFLKKSKKGESSHTG